MTKNSNGNGASTQIVPLANYAVMRREPDEVLRALRENAGTVGFSQFDLERITMPAGGGRTWEVLGPDGETENLEQIEAVIIGFVDGRAYWRKSFEKSGGGSPPDCSSNDTLKGHGADGLGGVCADCQWSQFGSAENGKGQACKQVRSLFIMRPESMMPVVLCLPPTSLKPCRRFLMLLGGRGLSYAAIVVRIGLHIEQKNNKKYSQATFTVAQELTDEQATKFRSFGEILMPLLRAAAIDEYVNQSDVADGAF